MNIYEPSDRRFCTRATFVTIQHLAFLYDCKSITSTFQFISIERFIPFSWLSLNQERYEQVALCSNEIFFPRFHQEKNSIRRKKKRKQHYCFKTKFILVESGTIVSVQLWLLLCNAVNRKHIQNGMKRRLERIRKTENYMNERTNELHRRRVG